MAASADSGGSEVISWGDIRQEYQDLTRQEKAPYIDAMVDHIVEHIDTVWDTATESLYRFDSKTGLYIDDATDYIRKYVYEQVGGVVGTYELRELLDRMRVINRTDLTEAQDPPGYICLKNGVFDVEEGSLLPHSPEFIFLNRWQVSYDESAECPRWKAFLQEVLQTDSDRMKLQEFAGYTLMGWDYTHHKALFVVGPTASGKSTMMNVLQAMLGAESFSNITPQQLIYDEYAPARLYAKKANFRSDIPADSIKNTGLLKEILGGDRIWANIKYKEPFEFWPTAKHYYAANQLPKIGESDEAFFRRVMLLPVPTTVPEEDRDTQLVDELTDELPGILNWAIEGMYRLIEQKGFTGDMSPFQTENTWQEWGNSVGRFEQIALRSGETHIPKSDIYAAYLQFCDDKNIPSESQNMMTRELKELGYTDGQARVDGIKQRVFLNLEWTDGGLEYHEDTQFTNVANQDLDYYE
jgi:putative DNA primase/helicase